MSVELAFTDKEITAWGDMGLMKRMLDRIGFESALQSCGLPQPLSNRGYRPEQLGLDRLTLDLAQCSSSGTESARRFLVRR